MQSFYHHHHPRKLLKVTASPSIPKSCQSPCDPHKNTLGSCPIACIGLCRDVCKYSLPISSITQPSSAPDVAQMGPSQHFEKSHHLSPYGIVFIAVVIAACLALTVYATYKLCKRRRRSSSTERVDDHEGEEQNPNHGDHELVIISDEDEDDYGPVLDNPIWYIRTVGLLPSVIGSITVVHYKKGDGLIEGTGCSVCLTEFEEDEGVKLLPKCSHAFHINCVDTWLRSHTNCPLCRAPVMNNASQEMTTLQNTNAVEDAVSSCNNSDDEGGVVGIMELENDGDDDDGPESRINRGFDDRRDGFKIVHELEDQDCNSARKSVVVNFDQCTVESL